jgi:hypothetical protein
MGMVDALRRLSSACAVFFAPRGAVSDQARQQQRSRQALYREADQALAAVASPPANDRRAALEQALAQRDARLAQLERRLAEAVLVSEDTQAEFAATAQAIGVSLAQARPLLAVLLRDRTPAVATLGRYAAAAARRAAAALAPADERARPRVVQAVADEVYCGRTPVLMAVEPESLCWLSARRLAGAVTAADWAEEFGRLPALGWLVTDAGSALRKGAALARAARPGLRHGLDVFHLFYAGRRALRLTWQAVSRLVDRADRLQKEYDRQGRAGQPRTGGQGQALGRAWRQAEQAMDQAAATERAWQEVRAALDWFTPLGQLQTRAGAEAAVARALPRLSGPHWDKARGLLKRPETFAFLDRVQAELEALRLAPATRAALLELEGLRRRPELLRGESTAAAAARGVALVCAAQLAQSESDWPAQLEAVRAALRRAWRASSLVECVNSVARMQQARHRKLTQGLLDLKRWYWNQKPFRTGRRKGKTPYGLLGVQLPPGSWWELLKLPPEQLRQQLSAQKDAA